jgi:diguanylate cyclase (GGDEF)-like protein
MRVLLIEPDLSDTAFLTEALAELEEQQYGETWMRVETVHAVDLSEALAELAPEGGAKAEGFDVLLLNPMLPDRPPLRCFVEVAAAAPDTPVILLAGREEESLATRLIRHGAQDFLLKNEVDCAPLARAIRNAIERHRAMATLRGAAFLDPLTGIYNPTGFCALAYRNLRLADRIGRQVLLVTAELEDLRTIESIHGFDHVSIAVMEAADALREAAGETDLVGRLGEQRFGVLIFDLDTEETSRTLNRLEQGAAALNVRGGAFLSLRIARFHPSDASCLEALLETAT